MMGGGSSSGTGSGSSSSSSGGMSMFNPSAMMGGGSSGGSGSSSGSSSGGMSMFNPNAMMGGEGFAIRFFVICIFVNFAHTLLLNVFSALTGTNFYIRFISYFSFWLQCFCSDCTM